MASNNSSGNYATAAFIVSSVAGQGNYTTIASALADATSGDTIFIMPGTYTEPLTLVAGVNLTAYDGDALTPTVTIKGNCQYSAAGTISISGIYLETNGDFLLEIFGAATLVVNLINCFLNYAKKNI